MTLGFVKNSQVGFVVNVLKEPHSLIGFNLYGVLILYVSLFARKMLLIIFFSAPFLAETLLHVASWLNLTLCTLQQYNF